MFDGCLSFFTRSLAVCSLTVCSLYITTRLKWEHILAKEIKVFHLKRIGCERMQCKVWTTRLYISYLNMKWNNWWWAYFGFMMFLDATAAARFEYFNFVGFRWMQQLLMVLVVRTWWSWIGHASWRQFTCHLGPINHSSLCVWENDVIVCGIQYSTRFGIRSRNLALRRQVFKCYTKKKTTKMLWLLFSCSCNLMPVWSVRSTVEIGFYSHKYTAAARTSQLFHFYIYLLSHFVVQWRSAGCRSGAALINISIYSTFTSLRANSDHPTENERTERTFALKMERAPFQRNHYSNNNNII